MTPEVWARIEAAFGQALETPAAERPAFLASLSDPEVRQEVERILKEEGKPTLHSPVHPAHGAMEELSAGDTLVQYRVEAKIGEGGMGAVYRAYDPRLRRRTALKVLPIGVSGGQERITRMKREARAASSLSHPHIVTIYDIGFDQGLNFIAMEYIDGGTLAQRIGGKGLPLEDALEIGAQIAGALAFAHAHGIMHRDLKPSNVMLDEHGSVKLVDFGLAKTTAAQPTGDGSNDDLQTGEGVIAGTAAYMSPEQAAGQPVDARSDIFSFGSVFYEMVTGRRAFGGETPMATLAAVMKDHPRPAGELVSGVPQALDRLIARSLEKQPERRWQSMADLQAALVALREQVGSARLEASAAAARRRKRLRVWAGAAAVLLASLAGGVWIALRPAPWRIPDWQIRQITSDDALHLRGFLSPNGKLVAYVSDRAEPGRKDLYVQPVDGGSAVLLTDGKQQVGDIAFSADGTLLAYRTTGEDPAIYTIPVVGGEPHRVAGGPKAATQVRFSPDGNWICYREQIDEYHSRYSMIPLAGGKAHTLAPKLCVYYRFLWSPDSRGILVMAAETVKAWTGGDLELWYLGLDGSAMRTGARAITDRLGLGDLSPIACRDGRLFFTAFHDRGRGGNMDFWQMRLSPDMKARGPVEALTSGWADRRVISISADGKRLLFTDPYYTGRRSLWSIPLDAENGKATGQPERLSASESNENQPAALDNGRRLLFCRSDGSMMRFLIRDFASGRETVLAGAPPEIDLSALSPSGDRIAYTSDENKSRSLYVASTRGGSPRRICTGCGNPHGWSPDGSKILVVNLDGQPVKAGWVDAGTGETKALLEHSDNILDLNVSPDGRWLLFAVASGGRTEIRIAPYREATPVPKTEWAVFRQSDRTEVHFRWSPRGRLMYFLRSDREGWRSVWAVPFDTEKGRAAGEPFAVYTPESPRLAPYGLASMIGMSVTADRLFLGLTARHSNLWLAEAR